MNLRLPSPITTTMSIALAAAAVVAAVLILVLVWSLVRVQRRRRAGRRASRAAASRSGVAAVPPASSPALPVPPEASSAPASSQMSESELTTELRQHLAGSPLDTVTDASGLGAPPDRVIWVENGHELLVHLDSLVARVRPGLVLVSLDMEADQAGRTTVVVPFAVTESEDDEGSLVAVTEERPRGDPAVVAHWGTTIQEAVWATLLGIAGTAAEQRGHLPTAIAAADGMLHMHSAPVRVSVSAGVLAT